jgi:glucosylglycerate synthase
MQKMETLSHRAPREGKVAIHAELKLEDETFLTDDFLRQLINVGEVDILVGLPTHNNAKTIRSIVQTIQSGILQAFPRERAVIIIADGGSRDGTPELVTGISIDDVRPASNLYALRTLHSISTKYGSTPATGVALRTILAAADLLRAKACIVMFPESATIESEWVSKLVRPIYRDGFDLVTPTYRRHKSEGLLMTNLLYPMIRALYGIRIREPYTAEFGFSGRLGSHFLNRNGWNDGTSGAGVELRLTLAAITGGYRICQSFLGQKERVDRRAADLVLALRQTVGPLFSALESDSPVWSIVTGSQPVPTTGNEQEVLLEPMRVNRKRLREMFSNGVAELNSVFQLILSPSTLAELQRIAPLGEDEFRYPAELWVRTVYEFAASFQKSVISRDHTIQALAPLFRGRALTFLIENRNASAKDVEDNIEGLCLEFERLKPYLLQMWKSRE